MKRHYVLAGAASIAFSSPALADHAAPAGIDDGGATVNVLSAEGLDQGRASVGLRLSYSQPGQRSDDELAALAGRHIHAHNSDYNLNAAMGFAYGITDRLTVSAELPYVRRDGLREGSHAHVGGVALDGVEELGSVAGIGDASVLAKYKLVDTDGAKFALVGGLKMPTGSTHRHSNEGERLETEHQPGTGSWDPIVGASFGMRAGPLHLTASALYQFSRKGAQDTRLGDRAQGGLGLSHRFGRAEHHHDEYEHHHDGAQVGHRGEPETHGHTFWDAFVELTGEWEGRQKVAGEIEEQSGGKSVWLTPGARFNSAGGWSAGLGVGVPVWQKIRESHPNNDYRITLSIGRAL